LLGVEQVIRPPAIGRDDPFELVAEQLDQPVAMPTEFVAHNGAVLKQTTPITVTGCARKAQKHAKHGNGKSKKQHKKR
jgi:hypothetical protein